MKFHPPSVSPMRHRFIELCFHSSHCYTWRRYVERGRISSLLTPLPSRLAALATAPAGSPPRRLPSWVAGWQLPAITFATSPDAFLAKCNVASPHASIAPTQSGQCVRDAPQINTARCSPPSLDACLGGMSSMSSVGSKLSDNSMECRTRRRDICLDKQSLCPFCWSVAPVGRWFRDQT